MTAPVARRAGRVLLVDAQRRVLLFRAGDPLLPARGTWWVTPGGGLDDGESFAQGAARELGEETGLVVDPVELGGVVLERESEFRWNGGHYLQTEEFFLLRVDSHVVDQTGLSSLEVACFVEHRWWDLDALAATADVVYPPNLAELLGRLGV